MDFSKKQIGIFYIENSKAFFYTNTFPSILQIDFPSNTFHDLEIINRKNFDEIIGSFIESNAIHDFAIAIILSPNATFERNFDQENDATDDAVGSFLEVIPFEDVISRIYTINKTKKIIAANKQLCEIVQATFEVHQCSVITVAPYAMLQEVMPELKENIDLSSIAGKMETVKQYSLFTIGEIQKVKLTSTTKQTKANTRLFLLLGVLGLLFVILLGMIYYNIILPAKTQTTIPVTPVIPSSRVQLVTPIPSIMVSPINTNLPQRISTPAIIR
jgi:hypothetical protein